MLVLMTVYVDKIEVTYKKKTIFGKEKEYTKCLDWYESSWWKEIISQDETEVEIERIRKVVEDRVREAMKEKFRNFIIDVELNTRIKDLHTFKIKELLELLTPEQFKSEFGFLFNEVKN